MKQMLKMAVPVLQMSILIDWHSRMTGPLGRIIQILTKMNSNAHSYKNLTKSVSGDIFKL